MPPDERRELLFARLYDLIASGVPVNTANGGAV
jgi:hypothetical protein